MVSKNVKRILLADDNVSIHKDFRDILVNKEPRSESIQSLESELFGMTEERGAQSIEYKYIIDSAYQGEEAVELVDKAVKEEFPYSLIFMDVRMPPGIDGLKAIQKIWSQHPDTEIVICTAYSDYTWDEIVTLFGRTDHLLFIKKPFNNVEIKQIALTLSTKWELNQENQENISNLKRKVRT